MAIAHSGVGMFAIGASGVESYKIEKDVALKPGDTYSIAGYDFRFVSAADVRGPNYDAVQALVEVTRGGKPRRRLEAAEAPFLGAADRQQPGRDLGELGARFVRRDGQSPGQRRLEHAHPIQAAGALHLARRVRDGGRRRGRGDRPALSAARQGGLERRGGGAARRRSRDCGSA